MGFKVSSNGLNQHRVVPSVPMSCSIGVHDVSLKAEDRHAMQTVQMAGMPTLIIASVFDGHGGSAASQQCSERMAAHIASIASIASSASSASDDGSLSSCDTCESSDFGPLSLIGRYVRDAFEQLHCEIREAYLNAGTTATVLVIDTTNFQVLCANVGDTEAIVLDSSHWAMVTVNHRLSASKNEVDRVRRAGAAVWSLQRKDGKRSPVGGLRLWPGGLSMGRSLGDADCGAAVIAKPAVQMVDVIGDATFVVCSDGVWDSLDIEDVLRAARTDCSADDIARDVVTSAVAKRGLRDDTTCMVIKLGSDGSFAEASHDQAKPRRRSTTVSRISSLFGRLLATRESSHPAATIQISTYER